MPPAPPPLPPDAIANLPSTIYYQVVHDLHAGLPEPADNTPDALAQRLHSAIAQVASMLPANAEEASIAARCVAAHAQAMDAQRLARQFPNDAAHVNQCTAQSGAMMRAANSSRSLLLRVQAVRQKREANPVTCGKAAWIEHCAIGLMAGALNQTAPEPPPPPEPVPEPEPVAEPEPAPAPTDKFHRLTEAEQYAVLYPRRAALIRAHGGVPDNCGFGPPRPALAREIIASKSPILLELDKQQDPVPA